MKKSITITLLLLLSIGAYCQQFPLMEGYNINPYCISPAYAGVTNPGTLFVDYRSDWSGLSGGPRTYQLTYNDRLFEKVGVGVRFLYDKTDIFKQTYLMGSYRYEVKLTKDHFLNFGLSAGIYRNTIDMAKYYNNPDFILDNVLINGYQKSKIKFATDLSILYHFREFEGGLVFSNIMFGAARYIDSNFTYKPVKNFLAHLTYEFQTGEKWAFKPFFLVRGGEHYPTQFEAALQASYIKRIWVTALYRTGGIFGLGFGTEPYRGILLNYSYNLSSNVTMNAFGSHQITLGVRISDKEGSSRRNK